jgi:hypothetical protein
MNETEEIIEAKRYALSLEVYRELRGVSKLKNCLPPEGGTCTSAEAILASLLNKYDINDLISKKTPEYKKGKELLLSCLLVFILKNAVKNEMVVCIPSKDEGTDIYIREMDYEKQMVIMKPLQICEFPEQYIADQEKDFTRKVFNFIKDTKFKYAKGADALLLWLEPSDNSRLEIARLREMFAAEAGKIPFVQIVIFGRNDDLFNIATAYSKDPKNNFVLMYNYKESKIATR